MSELPYLAAGRYGQHLLEGHHAFARDHEFQRRLVGVVAVDAAVVDYAHGDFAREHRLFHLPREIEQLDGLELLERLVRGIQVLKALAIDLAEHHQVRLAEAIDWDEVAAALARELEIGQVLP